MLPRGLSFPDQTAHSEPVALFVRRHWIAFFSWGILIACMLLGPVVVALFLAGLGAIPALTKEQQTFIILGGSAYYLFVLAVFLAAWIDYYLDVTIVTERRLVDIHQNGLFNHRVSEQSLLRVQDVSVKVKGLVQTFFRFGTVYVETAGEAPNFVMQNLPNPNQVANKIIELHNQLIDQGYDTNSDTQSQAKARKLTLT